METQTYNITKDSVLTKEQIEQFLYLHSLGWSTKHICEEIGIKTGQGYKFVQRHGIKSNCRNYIPLSENEISKIKELYNGGMNIEKLAEHCRGMYSEYQIRCAIGDDIRANGARYTVNHEYFSVIDTEEKAYWLGFLFADGCIQRDNRRKNPQAGWSVSFGLMYDDKDMVEKFARCVGSNQPLKEYYQERGYTKPKHECHVNITSYQMAQDLMGYGMYMRKSLTLDKLPDITNELMRHFVRGFYDGNGSIFFDKENEARIYIAIYSTHAFLDKLLDVIDENIDIKRKNIYDHTVEKCSFVKYAHKDSIKILDWIYHDATIYLPRKHEKYITAKNAQE